MKMINKNDPSDVFEIEPVKGSFQKRRVRMYLWNDDGCFGETLTHSLPGNTVYYGKQIDDSTFEFFGYTDLCWVDRQRAEQKAPNGICYYDTVADTNGGWHPDWHVSDNDRLIAARDDRDAKLKASPYYESVYG